VSWSKGIEFAICMGEKRRQAAAFHLGWLLWRRFEDVDKTKKCSLASSLRHVCAPVFAEAGAWQAATAALDAWAIERIVTPRGGA